MIADCRGHERYPAHYLGYFKCFNEGLYYEAHDVLEELWLADKSAADARYYQGLIQYAGAYVHLQKERLAPAYRLFGLALNNFANYPGQHLGVDLADVCCRAEAERAALLESDYTYNALQAGLAPRLEIQ